ncbi:MAG: hypothetical protein RLZZ299_2549 [Pseudomonadota bacterium]
MATPHTSPASALGHALTTARRRHDDPGAWTRALATLRAATEEGGLHVLPVGPAGLEGFTDGPDAEAAADLLWGAWRDGLRELRLPAGLGSEDLARVVTTLADSAGTDAVPTASAARDSDAVTLLAALDVAGLDVRSTDPYARPDVHRRAASYDAPIRPEAAMALHAAVAAGVEAARQVLFPRPDAAGKAAWRESARVGTDTQRGRIVAWFCARDGVPDAEWATLLAGCAADGAWGALGAALDHLAASGRPLASLHALLATRPEALAAAMVGVRPEQASPVARWLAWLPAPVRDACTDVLAREHEPARSGALLRAWTAAGHAAGAFLMPWAGAPGRAALWAVRALREGHPSAPESLETLRRALFHPEEGVRQEALLGLSGDRDPATLQALLEGIGARRADLLVHVLGEVVRAGDPAFRDAVLARVQSPDFDALPPNLRARFLGALAHLGGEEARAWCVSLLKRRVWFGPRELRERQLELAQALREHDTSFSREVRAEVER